MVTASDLINCESAQLQNHSCPTPGPWLVEPINGGQTYQITSAEDNHFAVIAETPIDGTGRDEANARLIAVAPDLLEKLQQFVNWTELHKLNMADCIDGKQRECLVVINARAVIAKAMGGAA